MGSLNITRMGHYHTPSGTHENGSCHMAAVAGVNADGTVNLATWNHDGTGGDSHQSVTVGDPQTDTDDGAVSTFHLSQSCPFGRGGRKMMDFSIEATATARAISVTAAYPSDEANYWVAVTGPGGYEVYKVLQEFTGWDAPQPVVFGDTGTAILAPGDYTVSLRERVPWRHSFTWRTHASVAVTVPA